MRTNLSKHFGVNETRMVPLPWPELAHVSFEIARAGNDGFQSWVKEQQRTSPLFKKMGNAMMRAKLAEQRAGRRASRDATVAQVLNKTDFSEDLFTERDLEGLAKYLLLGWDGITDAADGSVVECDMAARMELLQASEPVGGLVLPEGAVKVEKDGELVWPDDVLEIEAGTGLGDALFLWIMWEANRHEEYRSAWLEDQGKNFEASSASS